MRRAIPIVIFLLAVSSGPADEKDKHSTPTLVNAGFEAKPDFKGWARPGWPYRSRLTAPGRSDGQCACLEDDTGMTWGFLQQTTPISPGSYRTGAHVRLEGGCAMLWVRILDAKMNVLAEKRAHAVSHRLNPMAPDFIPAELMRGSADWQPIELSIDAPAGARHINFRIGFYFMPGKMYYDDAFVEKVPNE